MDPKRADVVNHIQQALASARKLDDAMTEYLLDCALRAALEPERREIAESEHPSIPAPRHH